MRHSFPTTISTVISIPTTMLFCKRLYFYAVTFNTTAGTTTSTTIAISITATSIRLFQFLLRRRYKWKYYFFPLLLLVWLLLRLCPFLRLSCYISDCYFYDYNCDYFLSYNGYAATETITTSTTTTATTAFPTTTSWTTFFPFLFLHCYKDDSISPVVAIFYDGYYYR